MSCILWHSVICDTIVSYVTYRVCFFGSSKCLQDRPHKKELQPVSGIWRKYVTWNWQSSRGVSSSSGWIEECYPDEKETRGSIIHHRRFSSNFNTFLRNLSVPATSIIPVVSLVADRCHWCHTAPISSNWIRVKGGVGQVSLEEHIEHIYSACVVCEIIWSKILHTFVDWGSA